MRLRPILPLSLVALALPASAAAAPVVTATTSTGPLRFEVRIDRPAGATPLSPEAAGQLPGTKELKVALGPGFALAPAGFVTCKREDLAKRGPEACPAEAQFGTGEVAFEAYVGGSTLSGMTDDLRLYRGSAPDEVLVYIHTSEPAETTFVFAGRATATSFVLDLSPALKSQGFDVALRRITFLLDRVGSGDAAAATDTAAKAPRVGSCKRLRGARRARCVRRNRDIEFCRTPKAKPKPRATPRQTAAASGRFLDAAGACPTGGRKVTYGLAFSDGTTATAETTVACA